MSQALQLRDNLFIHIEIRAEGDVIARCNAVEKLGDTSTVEIVHPRIGVNRDIAVAKQRRLHGQRALFFKGPASIAR